MPLTPATAIAAIAHTRGLGALRPAASDAGSAPRAMDHATALARRLGEPVLGGNRALLLQDGRDARDAMFKAIDGAREHINIESRLGGGSGADCPLADKLIERRRAGVRVNWLFDGTGSTDAAAAALQQRVRDAGIQLLGASPVRRWRSLPAPCAPRRLLVVDGRIGFVGGTDIGSTDIGSTDISSTQATNPATPADDGATASWHDLQVQLEGPAVRRLQQLFIAQWLRHAGSAMQQARYFPPLAPVGTHRVGVVACDGAGQRQPQASALLGAIATARGQVLLSTSGLAWRPSLQRALLQAAERGVRVELLLPADAHGAGGFWPRLVAGHWLHPRLLQAGVSIRTLHRPQLHRPQLHDPQVQDPPVHQAESCVVDSVWASIGCSSGADATGAAQGPRASLVVVVDQGFAGQLEQAFWADAACASPVEKADALRADPRALWQRCRDSMARRFAHPS